MVKETIERLYGIFGRIYQSTRTIGRLMYISWNLWTSSPSYGITFKPVTAIQCGIQISSDYHYIYSDYVNAEHILLRRSLRLYQRIRRNSMVRYQLPFRLIGQINRSNKQLLKELLCIIALCILQSVDLSVLKRNHQRKVPEGLLSSDCYAVRNLWYPRIRK